MMMLLSICFFMNSIEAKADVPYDTYSYNYWGEVVKEPHSYLYNKTINQDNFGSKLSYPSDLFVTEDKLVIADTGNSRVIVCDLDGIFNFEIKTASSENDYLKSPQGVYVTKDGHIYIADTGNARIVEYDENGNYIREIGKPTTSLISDSQDFSPTKVAVDNIGRIYVIAYGINMGLVEFDKDGKFEGFIGATEVSVSTFTYIWKNYFSTEAQQDRMETIVPTEYSNIFIDNNNFIYATINNLSDEDLESGADTIRRLNPTGTDVLRRLGQYDIIGDLTSTTFGYDWSSFVDVAANDLGCYFILDKTDGKIFAYDNDGISLFVFGRNGIREGNFQNPVSIGISKDLSHIYILDSTLGSVLVFDITEYGRHLMNAIELNNIGDSEGSTNEWLEVLNYNTNSELAYVGLGKAYLTEEKYKEAMECFKLGNNKKYYSEAFRYYRKDLMEKYLTKVVIGFAFVIIVIFLIKRIRSFRKWVGELRCNMENQ